MSLRCFSKEECTIDTFLRGFLHGFSKCLDFKGECKMYLCVDFQNGSVGYVFAMAFAWLLKREVYDRSVFA